MRSAGGVAKVIYRAIKYSQTKYASILRIETACVRSDFNLVLTSRELQVYSIEKQRVKFKNINYHDVIRFKTGEFCQTLN